MTKIDDVINVIQIQLFLVFFLKLRHYFSDRITQFRPFRVLFKFHKAPLNFLKFLNYQNVYKLRSKNFKISQPNFKTSFFEATLF